MRLILTSDTHGLHNHVTIPDGDIFIYAGDFSNQGTFLDVLAFDNWLHTLPHPHKIVIAGNHDLTMERAGSSGHKMLQNATYLLDESVSINGYNIYGSPWQPEFNNWAFNLPRGTELKKKWDMIPNETDILITHGPAYGILDFSENDGHIGCEDLKSAIERVQPKLHVFGHIHEAYGKTTIGSTTFINASICTLDYRPINPPQIIDL